MIKLNTVFLFIYHFLQRNITLNANDEKRSKVNNAFKSKYT